MKPESSLPFHKSLTLIPTLSQMHPIHLPNLFPKIHSNIIFPSRQGLMNGPNPKDFPSKILYEFLISPVRATCPAHLIRLDFYHPNITE
jgi:hypothetical protein